MADKTPVEVAPPMDSVSLLYGTPETPETPPVIEEAAVEPEVTEEVAAEPEGDEVDETAPAEPDAPEIKSFAELAAHLEVEPDWIQTLQVPLKINGQSEEASLGDLVKSYQIGKASEAELVSAKEKSAQIIDEAKAQRDSWQANAAAFGQLLKHVETEIDRDMQGVDWAKLRREDPAEHSAKKLELAERREQIKSLKDQASQSIAGVLQAQQQQTSEQRNQYLSQQWGKLIDALPEWKDDAVSKAEQEKISTYLLGAGFDADEVRNAGDHRQVLLARKAMLYDQAQAKVSAIKKKVVTIPKTLKPGSSSSEPAKPAAPDDPVSIMYGSS